MKLPPPKTDYDLVDEIEKYLNLDAATRILEESPPTEDGLVVTLAAGMMPDMGSNPRPGTRRPQNYARPMFQVLAPGSFSGTYHGIQMGVCQCYRFERSWACPEHPEKALSQTLRPWAERPLTEPPTALGSTIQGIIDWAEEAAGVEVRGVDDSGGDLRISYEVQQEASRG